MLQQLIRALLDHRFRRCNPCVLPQSRGHLTGSSRATAAGRRPQTKAASIRIDPPRPVVLDDPAARLAALVGGSSDCENRRRWSDGIGRAFACTGACDHGRAAADPR